MPIVADASVAIRGDLTGFRQDLNKAKAETGSLGSSLRNILSPKNIIRGAGLVGIGLGIKELAGHALDAAAAFSELQQTQATTDEVFGDSAAVIEDWATRAGSAAGMSQREVFQAASIMGGTLRNMGFAADEAAEKTVMLQQRAAEMGVAFGTTTERALLGITAAMRGERDTIEKFSVAIKQVDVNARVAALGLDTSTAAAKKNAEAMAVLDLVMEQTDYLAGRFADGQEQVAVKMMQANAAIDDFMTTQVGPAVASIQLGAVKVGEAFVDATEGVGMFFDNIFNPEKQAQVQMLADLWGVSFNEASARIQEGANEAGLTWENQLAFMADVTETTAGEVEETSRRIPRGVSDALEDGEPRVRNAAEIALANPMIVAMLGGQEEAERIAGETPGGIAQALLDAQFLVEDAMTSLVETADEALTPMQEQAQIRGFLASKELADALASNKPAVAQRARELKEAAEARLAELESAAFFHGLATAQSYAAGMNAGYGVVRNAAGNLAAATRNQIGINSEPADPSSPLRGITKWGGNIVRTIADGIYGELGTGSGAAAALAGALVPAMGGGTLGAYGAGMGGSETRNYYLTVQGIPHQVSSPEEMVEKLMELGAMNPEGRLL